MKRWNEKIGVDEWLRVPSTEYVLLIGNCARIVESISKKLSLLALAQANK